MRKRACSACCPRTQFGCWASCRRLEKATFAPPARAAPRRQVPVADQAVSSFVNVCMYFVPAPGGGEGQMPKAPKTPHLPRAAPREPFTAPHIAVQVQADYRTERKTLQTFAHICALARPAYIVQLGRVRLALRGSFYGILCTSYSGSTVPCPACPAPKTLGSACGMHGKDGSMARAPF